jgi:hypothetical protein
MRLTIDQASGMIPEGVYSLIGPYIDDSIPPDRHCLRKWIGFVTREDSRVRDNDIGRWHASLLKKCIHTGNSTKVVPIELQATIHTSTVQVK